MPDLVLSIAGALRLQCDDAVVGDEAFGGRQLRLVAVMLMLERNDPIPGGRLVEELWPSGPPDQFRPALRGLVSKVRNLLAMVGLDGDRITSRAGRYVVDLPELRVDVEQASLALAQALRLESDDPSGARELASGARAVLSRPVLSAVEGPWIDALRDRLSGDHLESLLVLGRCRRREGQVGPARTIAAEAVALAPLREDAWRLVMSVESAAGNAAAALEAYERLRGLLADELGTDPSAATQALHARILHDVPDAGVTPPPGDLMGDLQRGRRSAPVRNPYVGLRPYQSEDAARFFGRDAVTQGLLDRLAHHRSVVVVGPSGVGKSSIVRAGLLPALARGALPDSDTWDRLVISPGRSPLARLAAAIEDHGPGRPSGQRHESSTLEATLAADPRGLEQLLSSNGRPGRVLLVVDQAEELFTLADPDQASALIEGVATSVADPRSDLRLVVTLRADFYERAARHPGMAVLLSRSQLVVPPLRGDGLQLAITAPARQAGIRLEDGVLGRLVAEAGADASGLPLLQHALWELCRHRRDDRLTLAALDRLGGVTGALARHAEQVWSDLDPRSRQIARSLLLRSVAPTAYGPAGLPIDRSDLAALGDGSEVEAVITTLVEARLLTASGQDGTGRPTLAISHEAVFDAWPRLRGWIEAQRAQLLVARRLATAAEQWMNQGRHPDWLLSGRRLEDARELVEAVDSGSVDVVLTTTESALLAASEAAELDRIHREKDRRDREHDLQQSAIRGLRIGLALAAAENALDRDPERSLLLALAVADEVRAHAPEHEPTWTRLLHHGLANHLLIDTLPDSGPLLAVLADGRLVTLADRPSETSPKRRQVVIRDPDSGAILERLPTPTHLEDPQVDVARDGSRIAIGDAEGRIHVLATDSWDTIRLIEGPTAPIGSLALAPDGSLVAALWLEGTSRRLLVHDVLTGEQIHSTDPVVSRETYPGHQLDFHPRGDRLLVTTGSEHSRLRVLDVESWEVLAEHRIQPEVSSARYSPGGRTIGVAHVYGVSIHEADTLELRDTLRTVAKYPAACWTPDGTALLSAGNRLRLLAPDDREAKPIPPRLRATPRIGAPPDDRDMHLIPGSNHAIIGDRHTTELRRWDLGSHGTELARLSHGTAPGTGVAWSPNGQALATCVGHGWIHIWDTETWETTARHRITDRANEPGQSIRVQDVAWTPDGADIVATGSGGILRAINVTTSTPRFTRCRPKAHMVGDTDVSRDGRLIVATVGGLIEVLTRDGDLLATFQSPLGSTVEAVAISPNSRHVAATHWPTTHTPGAQGTTVWDWQTETVVAHLPGLANNLSFAPDGDILAVSRLGETTLWNTMDDTVVAQLNGHDGFVQDVTHSPDGRLIATGGWDGDVRLWDAESNSQRLHLTGQPHIHRIRFHPTRPWIALATTPGVVHVWTLDPDELIGIARARLTRELTTAERRNFLQEAPPGPT